MNIAIKATGFPGIGKPGLKSTQDRQERMAQRDNKIAFYEQQKENLKSLKTFSLEDISRKLEMLHNFDDQITLAKVEFNKSQVFHILDEAAEIGENIAEAAEENAPKNAEERREDIIEDATGVENDGGMLDEIMDEMEELTEEMMEKTAEEFEEMTEDLLSEKNLDQSLKVGSAEAEELFEEKLLADTYKRIDYRI